MNAEVKPIEFEILGQRYTATPRKTSIGSRLWQYPNSEESSGGAEIEPLADTLPEVVTVNDEKFKFGPVPRRGGATGTRSLDKTREVRVETTFDGCQVEVHCRVTTRPKKNVWHFWFRATQVDSSGSRPPSATRPEKSADSESLNRKWLGG